MPERIILYTAAVCGDCRRRKDVMDAARRGYGERDIVREPTHAQALAARTGKRGVPCLVIDGDGVRGCRPGQPFSEDHAREIPGLT